MPNTLHIRESFIFYSSFSMAVSELCDTDRLAVYDAITAYALTGEMKDLSGVPKAIMTLIRPQLDANNRRYENGCKGGRPKTDIKPARNQNATGEKPEESQKINDHIPGRNQSVSVSEPNENDNRNVNGNASSREYISEKFTPPTYRQVSDYCAGRKNTVDPGLFVDYYQSRGWKTGNTSMKDWKAAVRMWEKRETHSSKGPSMCREPASRYQQRMDTLTEVLSIINNENQQSDE